MTDDESRSIEIEIEVPGDIDEVWRAVATGPGVTSWYVPHTIEGRVGGKATFSFGPGMDGEGRVTAWEPPHRFKLEGEDPGEGLAFEWTVQARSDDSCTVRLINSGFGDGGEWDAQYDAMARGWSIFLTNLRLHLEYFAPLVATPSLPMAVWEKGLDDAWTHLTDHLDIPAEVEAGVRITVSGLGAPHLSGVVVKASKGWYSLLIDAPASGTGFISAEAHGDMTAVSIWTYLYNDEGKAASAGAEPIWRDWLETRGAL